MPSANWRMDTPRTDLIEGLRNVLHGGVSSSSLVRMLWEWRLRIGAVVLAAMIAGAGIGVILPRWYGSGGSFIVDAGPSPTSGNAVLGLASQLGLMTSSSSTSPQFYADLLESRTLLERLVTTPYPFRAGGTPQTLSQLWSGHLQPDAVDLDRAVRKLGDHYSASANPRTGVVTLTLEGPTPEVAKFMADTALGALNGMVVTIRRKRATAERQFLETQWNETRDSLTAHEDDLRGFYERNRQVNSPELQFEELRLRRQVDRVQTLYVGIGTQLEQARLQEVRDVPAIATIDEPIAPVRKSSPHIRSIVLSCGFLAAAIMLTLAIAEVGNRRLRSAMPR